MRILRSFSLIFLTTTLALCSGIQLKRTHNPKNTVMKVFGQERSVEIPEEVFMTADEMKVYEDVIPDWQHGWFESVYNKAQLHYRAWLPTKTKPKAIMVYMHGIQTHGGKAFVLKDGTKANAALTIDYCQKNDIAYYAFDLYGHGFSEGTRMLIPESYKNNQQDLVNFCNLVAAKHDESTPMFLVGESYGCTLSILVARQFQDNPSSGPKSFDSVILTGPAIVGDLPPYPVYFVLRYMLAPFFPRWRPSFMPNPVSPDRIWRDPEVLALRTDKRYLETGIDGSGIPFRLGTALNLVMALEEARGKAIPGFTKPFCLIHGAQDYACPVEGSEFMFKTAATAADEKEFHCIEGAYHDILADPTKQESLDKMAAFIQKRLTALGK